MGTTLRYYVVGLSSQLGGQAGVDQMKEIVHEIVKYRQVSPPTKPSDLIAACDESAAPYRDQEVLRAAGRKDCAFEVPVS